MSCCGAPKAGAVDLAAMCWSCPHGRSCGRTVAELTIMGSACPRGLLPTAADPTFVWRGARWRGVPWPVRLAAVVRFGRSPDDFEGCGCLDLVKHWLERLHEPVGRVALRLWRTAGVARR